MIVPNWCYSMEEIDISEFDAPLEFELQSDEETDGIFDIDDIPPPSPGYIYFQIIDGLRAELMLAMQDLMKSDANLPLVNIINELVEKLLPSMDLLYNW
jgi:hypothetical protein